MHGICHSLLLYNCFDKGCPATAQKRTRQCRLVLWVVTVWRYLVEVHGVKLEGKRMPKYTRLCCFVL